MLTYPDAAIGRPTATGQETLAGLLARRAREQGDELLLIFEDPEGRVSRFTYAEMYRRAGRMANLLHRLGLGKGDAFHVHLPNCPEFYDCWFAVVMLGAVMVPTNPLSTAAELAYILEHAGCRVSITRPDLLRAVEDARLSAPALQHILLARATTAPPGVVLLADAL